MLMLNYVMETIFRVNAALDRGATATLAETYEQIEAGSLYEWLSHNFGCDFSIILSPTMADQKRALIAAFRGWAKARKGDESAKYGVTRNGLCLIVGFACDIASVDDLDASYYKNFKR
jgi:hypothetical protein